MAHLNFIGGKWVPAQSGATDEVVAPATGAVIASVPSSAAADVDAAVAGLAVAPELVRRPHHGQAAAHVDDRVAVALANGAGRRR